MASQKKNMICVMFTQHPNGSLNGSYSWMLDYEAKNVIEAGYGYEYDPASGEQAEGEPEAPLHDFPDDFPAAIRNIFLDADIYSFDKVKELAEAGDLQSVTGIGASTEHKINTYLED